MTALLMFVLVVALAVTLGYAAVIRRDLHEADDLLSDALADNAALRGDVSSHEICLALLLAELEDLS